MSDEWLYAEHHIEFLEALWGDEAMAGIPHGG